MVECGMERYVEQLLEDIAHAAKHVEWPYREKAFEIWDWISDEEEERTAPRRSLEKWTGIQKVQLPPPHLLTDDQVRRLLHALQDMLDAYNWSFVIQIAVPERIQYAAIRDYFDQVAIIKTQNMGFFELCRPGTPHGKCALGEYCHCRFFKELRDGFVDEDLSPEEERARHLEIEISHLQRKYGEEWEKYYPYHLDPEYDDEKGKPYDYGFGEMEDPDDWWRKG